MNVLAAKGLDALKNSYSRMVEVALIAVQWKLKFIRVQLTRWTRCSAQKELEKAYRSLGAEIFAVYKGGQHGWETLPLVQQKLRLVEGAESKLFVVDDAIKAITDRYHARKEAICEKYQGKRAVPSARIDS
jgi:hypothetical protein